MVLCSGDGGLGDLVHGGKGGRVGIDKNGGGKLPAIYSIYYLRGSEEGFDGVSKWG